MSDLEILLMEFISKQGLLRDVFYRKYWPLDFKCRLQVFLGMNGIFPPSEEILIQYLFALTDIVIRKIESN